MEGLIPPAMRPAVQAGPAEGDVWCLLVKGSAAAAKLRQAVANARHPAQEPGLERGDDSDQGAHGALTASADLVDF